MMPATPANDTLGPMTRTVQDAAVLLGALAGYDPNDPIKVLISPDAKDLNDAGQLDASNEHAYTVAKVL